MSEEEKKAIKRIKFLIKEIKCECDICKLNVITFKIILNLINKQQKEIEGKNAVIDSFKHTEKVLTEQLDKQQKEIEDLNEIKQQICNEELITQDYVQDNFIAKDKIREKIENLNKEIASPFGARPDFQVIGEIKVLKELLGDEK